MGQGTSLMLQDEEIAEIAEETGCKLFNPFSFTWCSFISFDFSLQESNCPSIQSLSEPWSTRPWLFGSRGLLTHSWVGHQSTGWSHCRCVLHWVVSQPIVCGYFLLVQSQPFWRQSTHVHRVWWQQNQFPSVCPCSCSFSTNQQVSSQWHQQSCEQIALYVWISDISAIFILFSCFLYVRSKQEQLHVSLTLIIADLLHKQTRLRYDFHHRFSTREEFKFILNMMVGSNITTDQVPSNL